MKLLVSVVDSSDASEALEGGAHILDVKNPEEGSLGANFPWVIRQVREKAPPQIEVSATLGDLPNIAGTASLAALGAAYSGVDYVKVGLLGTKTADEALHVLKSVCRAVRSYSSSVKVIAAGYADFEGVGCINPLKLPAVAYEAHANGVLVDVKNKLSEKQNLLSFLTADQLQGLVDDCHKFGLLAALAGSLGKSQVGTVMKLGADIMGVRRSVCRNNDRVKGKVSREMVRELVQEVRVQAQSR